MSAMPSRLCAICQKAMLEEKGIAAQQGFFLPLGMPKG
jgi:hypothetical protein